MGQNVQLAHKRGRAVGFQAVARDITERVKARKEALGRQTGGGRNQPETGVAIERANRWRWQPRWPTRPRAGSLRT